jgi:hypothetical protein
MSLINETAKYNNTPLGAETTKYNGVKAAHQQDQFSSPLYSEAVIHNGLVFCSGKVGLDPSTGKLVGEGVAEQTVKQMFPDSHSCLWLTEPRQRLSNYSNTSSILPAVILHGCSQLLPSHPYYQSRNLI